MIHAVRANQPTFNRLEFTDGFNVVLADRTKESTKKGSRNGLGKSTLIEIIHFCLGAQARTNKGLRVEPLSGWEFSLDLSLGERRITVHRSVDKPTAIRIEGNVQGWQGKTVGESLELHLSEWTEILGEEMFGISSRVASDGYGPTFRSLISFFARRGPDAYSDPFEHFRKQREWDKQVNNAFLLGLSWRDAQEWQTLKDQQKALTALKKAVSSGVVEGMLGTVGELEAEKVRVEETARRQADELDSFKVHPEYREIEKRASDLTREIHELSNRNVADRMLLGYYREGLNEVPDSEPETVTALYEEAGVQLPGVVVKRLQDVQGFHSTLITNRRRFLASEIESLDSAIAEREGGMRQLTEERAELLEILRSHGALDEYTLLQLRHLNTVALLKDIETRLGNLKKFEVGKSALKVDLERLHQRARRDLDERKAIRERAISLFNAHSQALYEAPGRLVIDLGDSGFRFKVEIERSGSQGIEKMKVFCYDLMLAQLWADKVPSPGFLIHDSTIFDGVDERQIALALERAEQVSRQAGFQYVCTFNSDTLPVAELSEEFDIDDHVRLRLTDTKPEGSLLGIRY